MQSVSSPHPPTTLAAITPMTPTVHHAFMSVPFPASPDVMVRRDEGVVNLRICPKR